MIFRPLEITAVGFYPVLHFVVELREKVDARDAWYTIDGQKLSGKPTQKGIYIHNGRKVVN